MLETFRQRNWLLKKLLSLAGWIAILGFFVWVVNGIAEVEGTRGAGGPGGAAPAAAAYVLDSEAEKPN